jgi:hypothetical protein
VKTPAGTPIHPQFRIIDGRSIRFAESEGRNDDALLVSPWPESLFASSRSGRGWLAACPGRRSHRHGMFGGLQSCSYR